MLGKVIEGPEGHELRRSRQDQDILRKWKSDFQDKLETPDSPGWSYLDDHNWKILTTAMSYLDKNCLNLISKDHSGIESRYTVAAIWKLIRPQLATIGKADSSNSAKSQSSVKSFMRSVAPKAPITDRLQDPFEGRTGAIRLFFDRLASNNQDAHGQRWRFFNSWIPRTKHYLLSCCQRLPSLLIELEPFLRIMDRLERIEDAPFLADEPNKARGDQEWTVLDDEDIKQFVWCDILEHDPRPPNYSTSSTDEPAPAYTVNSLNRRVGLRQARMRRDLQTLGPAPGGGLLM